MKTTLPAGVSDAEFLSWPVSMNEVELIDAFDLDVAKLVAEE